MTPKQIMSTNQFIAEFMGFKMQVEDFHGINIIQDPDGETYDLGQLKYNTSWDYLMPVVEKIEDLSFNSGYGFSVIIDNWECFIKDRLSGEIIVSVSATASDNKYKSISKIDAVFKAVIEFINWYNNRNK